MARRVQEEDIVKINEAYLKIGTYAGAARATGWSAGTVKRYIIKDYVSKETLEPEKKIDFVLPTEQINYPSDWNDFLTLTDDELEDIKELQKSILI